MGQYGENVIGGVSMDKGARAFDCKGQTRRNTHTEKNRRSSVILCKASRWHDGRSERCGCFKSFPRLRGAAVRLCCAALLCFASTRGTQHGGNWNQSDRTNQRAWPGRIARARLLERAASATNAGMKADFRGIPEVRVVPMMQARYLIVSAERPRAVVMCCFVERQGQDAAHP